MPASVHAYFDADRRGDVDALVAAFSTAAEVRDEGARRQGRENIRAWWVAAKEASQHVTEPVEATTVGDVTSISARVSGTFPGSPIMLRFDFTIDRGEITRLEIA